MVDGKIKTEGTKNGCSSAEQPLESHFKDMFMPIRKPTLFSTSLKEHLKLDGESGGAKLKPLPKGNSFRNHSAYGNDKQDANTLQSHHSGCSSAEQPESPLPKGIMSKKEKECHKDR